MTPQVCRVRHDPPHSYGDCIRACVASLLDMECEQVPHFYEDGDGERGFERMRVWLAAHKRIPAYYVLDADMTFEQVAWSVGMYETNVMLYCSNDNGDHCIIVNRDGIAHDPAWYRSKIT